MRSRRIRRALASSKPLWGLLALSACGGPEPGARPSEAAELREPVINGGDDREELPVLEPAARETVAQSVAALMWMQRIDYEQPSALRAVSLAEAAGVCEDERFADQPTAAFCSGTLLDGDLLLTAGHCLGQDAEEAAERCRHLLVVFDYHLLEGGELALGSGDSVYSCRRVAHYEKATTGERLVDVAVLQLDRAVAAPHAPATIAAGELELGASLLAASHGAGLPLKVDRGAFVIDVPSDEYFIASTDSFGGGSGGPLFDASLHLVGYQMRGVADWKQEGGCLRATFAQTPREQHQRVETALRGLCDSGWPSERLCGTAPACGDAVCDASESADACSEDCPALRCGDGRCEVPERSECASDCSPFDGVPPDWLEDPATYDAGDVPAPRRTSKAGCVASGPAPAGSPTAAVGSLLCLLGVSLSRRRGR